MEGSSVPTFQILLKSRASVLSQCVGYTNSVQKMWGPSLVRKLSEGRGLKRPLKYRSRFADHLLHTHPDSSSNHVHRPLGFIESFEMTTWGAGEGLPSQPSSIISVAGSLFLILGTHNCVPFYDWKSIRSLVVKTITRKVRCPKQMAVTQLVSGRASTWRPAFFKDTLLLPTCSCFLK